MDTEAMTLACADTNPAPPHEAEQAVPEWVLLLEAARASHPKGKAGVAARLGVSRAYVSRAFGTIDGLKSGFAGGVPEKFKRLVIDRLHEVRECPATLQPQPVSECRRIAFKPAPTHNPLQMRIWRICQSCTYRPL